MGRLTQEIRSWGRVMLDLIYPRFCEGCDLRLDHRLPGYLCQSCLNNIRLFDPDLACQKCAKPLKGKPLSICSDCQNLDWAYDRCYVVAPYEGLLKELLIAMKYNKAHYLKETIKDLFHRPILEMINPNLYDFCIPVPVHPRKIRERGFSQTSLLAKSLEGIPCKANWFKRLTYSEGQTLMNRKDRLASVKDGFKLSRHAHIQGLKVLLIDDVFTTGATVHACSLELKQGGASQVDVAVLARSL